MPVPAPPPVFIQAPPPAPPMSKVIHIQHVFTPQQPMAAAPGSVSELPAQCPSECQQHCGPACARDGCCTDKKRKRNEMPHVPKSVLLNIHKRPHVVADD